MPGLVLACSRPPRFCTRRRAWMAGTSPATTRLKWLLPLPQPALAATKPAMADKPKKPSKLKARLPRGLEDRSPAALKATREMTEKIRAVYERYGFEPVETPT